MPLEDILVNFNGVFLQAWPQNFSRISRISIFGRTWKFFGKSNEKNVIFEVNLGPYNWD